MARPKKATGQLTFRCEVERHEELLQLAAYLGVDMNSLLNLLVKESLPKYLREAQRVEEEYRRARDALDELSIPTDEPVVRQMILEARKVPAERRMPVLHDAASRYRRPGDPPVEETVQYALRLLDKTEALERVRLLLQRRGTWSLDGEEETLGRQLLNKLRDDLHELKQRREEARRQSAPQEDGGGEG